MSTSTKKKLTAIILALLITFSLSTGCSAPAADEPASEPPASDTLIFEELIPDTPPPEEPAPANIVILYTNDVHCEVDQIVNDNDEVTNIGYAGVAAHKKEMEDTYGAGNVTLIDAGDAVSGGSIGTLTNGEYIVEIMNAVGYDIWSPGNHEFDFGMSQMLNLMDKSEAEIISCNFTDLAANAPVYSPYTIIEYGPVKVAYVGITTPESFTKTSPVYFQNAAGEYIYGLRQGGSGQELYDAVQVAVDDAHAEGADYIIAVGHLGIDDSSAPWRSIDVIENTTGINAFIDGHSHSEVPFDTIVDKDGKSVVLTQTGTKLANIGCMIIDTQSGTISAGLIPGYKMQDPDTQAVVEGMLEEFEAFLSQIVASTDVVLAITDPATENRMIRTRETNLGNLCSDAYRFVLGNGKTGADAGPADIAFVNGGGIRTDIPAGDITLRQLRDVHPFGNAGCVVETTGQQIIDALEMAARFTPEDENGGFLQVSGLTFTIDASVPSSVQTSDEGEFISVDGARRVKDVMVGEQPIELDKTYTLASHDYMLLYGGDGINMFRNGTIVVQPVIADYQIVMTFIEDYLGGVVGDDYSDPYGQGRIKILS